MKKLKFWIIVLAVIGIVVSSYLIFIAKNNDFEYYFDIPDELIVYNKGNVKSIKQNSEEYLEIMKLVDKRFEKSRKIDLLESSFEPQEEMKIKNEEIALEIVYNSTRTLKGGERKYSRLLMPLTYFNSDSIFFGDEEKYYGGPYGKLSSPRSLIRYINKIVVNK